MTRFVKLNYFYDCSLFKLNLEVIEKVKFWYFRYNVKEKFRAILEFTIDPNTGACKKELDIPLMVCSVLQCNSKVNLHDRITLLIESLKGSLEYLYKTFADDLIGIW